jgi:nitrite reductase [NAD(P)H] small subunit
MNDWIEVGYVKDIPRLGARVLLVAGKKIAVFRTAGDKIFALDDRCPHKKGPLSQGIVHGNRVTCPLHNLVLDLSQGEAVAPDEGCVATYPVKVDDGKILLSRHVVADMTL